MRSSLALRYIGIALQFAVLAVLARLLDPHEYGLYVLVLGFVMPSYFIFGFGTSETFVRDAPVLLDGHRAGEVRVLARRVWVTCGVSAAAVVAFGTFASWAVGWGSDASLAILFGSSFLVANGIVFNSAQILLGLGRQSLASFFFYPAINVTLALVAVPVIVLNKVSSFPAAATIVGSASVVCAVASVVVAMFHAGRLPNPATTPATSFLSGLALSGTRVLYSAGLWIPTVVAGILLSPSDAGILGTASRLAAAVAAVTAAMRFIVRPAIARAFANGDMNTLRATAGKASLLVTACACGALVAVFIAGGPLISLTFGKDLVVAQPLLMILIAGILIEGLVGPSDELLKMTGGERPVLTIYAAGVSTLAAAAFAVSPFGLIWSAIIQATYVAAVAWVFAFIVRRRLGFWPLPLFSRPRSSGGGPGHATS